MTRRAAPATPSRARATIAGLLLALASGWASAGDAVPLVAASASASASALEAVPPQVAAVAPDARAPQQVLVMLRSPPAHARLDGGYGGAG